MKIKIFVITVLSIFVMSCNSKKEQKVDSFDESITGKYWKLKILKGKDIKMEENQKREIFFTLKANDSTVSGFAGCNSLVGQFSIEKGNRIRFKSMGTTLMACQGISFNESEFLKVFELADNYTIKDDILSLNIGRKAPLAVFEAVYMK
jgi:heat shock protein HslJ